jgi:hypothetical protein
VTPTEFSLILNVVGEITGAVLMYVEHEGPVQRPVHEHVAAQVQVPWLLHVKPFAEGQTGADGDKVM